MSSVSLAWLSNTMTRNKLFFFHDDCDFNEPHTLFAGGAQYLDHVIHIHMYIFHVHICIYVR